jgi:proteasome lid subunit RPN8/RPN11
MLLADLSEDIKVRIRELSIAAYEENKEACGLVCGDKVVYCKNLAEDPSKFFKIDGRNLCRRDITAIWHSHNNGKSDFSVEDVRNIRSLKNKTPHILHDVANDRWRVADPSIDAPLLGTQFTYGVHDCYSIVRGWYWQNRRIELKDYDRDEYQRPDGSFHWQHDGWDLFRDYLAAEGFRQLPVSGVLEEGDVLLMCIQGVNPNHIAIVTDPAREIIMHQTISRLSCELQWDGYYRENTVAILRRTI